MQDVLRLSFVARLWCRGARFAHCERLRRAAGGDASYTVVPPLAPRSGVSRVLCRATGGASFQFGRLPSFV